MELDEFQQEMQNDMAQFEEEENKRQDDAFNPDAQSVKESARQIQSRQSAGGQSNAKASHHSSKKSITASAHKQQQEQPGSYAGEEEDIVCGRFPHMDICACDIQCSVALREINLFEVYGGILMGPYQAGFKTKQLIEMGVTHILNVTCREYMKRRKYFKYLDIQMYDAHNEDAKKYFRITNRFIEEGRTQGKVLVHSVSGKSRAPTFILAYLIGKEKMKLKDGINLLKQYVNEVEPNEAFMQQLADYDLEILSKY